MNAVKLSTRVWNDPVYFIAFGFGTGLIKKAPGTWGTLAAIPIYFLLAGTAWWFYLAITILAFFLGVYVSNRVSMDLGVHDYSGIVWDEVVGYLLTMFLVPPDLIWVALGFGLFRLFDIWKPEPIKTVDKYVKGGMGVMLDDILAAVMAWILLQILVWGMT